MKYVYYFLVFLFISIPTNAQISQRVEVNGRIIVTTNDVEGVTVFNTSSNKGTITNAKGEFTLEVMLNDAIEFSALQFEKFKVIIDEKILSNRYFTVYLVERINKLDEVIITPYDMLSGNIQADVRSVETFNPHLDAIYFGVKDVYGFEFTDDYKTEVVNPAIARNQFEYSPDLVKILGGLLKPVFKSEEAQLEKKLNKISLDLSDIYGNEFLSQSLSIPENRVEEFIAYVEKDQFDFHLLDKGKEIYLIEHLYNQSKRFLSADNAED